MIIDKVNQSQPVGSLTEADVRFNAPKIRILVPLMHTPVFWMTLVPYQRNKNKQIAEELQDKAGYHYISVCKPAGEVKLNTLSISLLTTTKAKL